MLTVVPDGDSWRVAVSFPAGWALGEVGCMLAAVVKHVAHNAGLEEEQLLFAIDHALDHMQGQTLNGGRVM